MISFLDVQAKHVGNVLGAELWTTRNYGGVF